MSNEGDGLSLVFLKAKKNMAFNFQSQKYLPQSICESIKRFYYMTQGKYMNTQVYLEQFQNMVVDVIEHTGGTIGCQPRLLEQLIMIAELNINQKMATQFDRLAAKKFLAVSFILGVNTT